MTHPKALTPPQKRAALASTDAPDTNKQRTFETRETEASHHPAVHNKITERNAANSPLLRLPAELRNMIYGRVFDNTTYNLDNLYEGETLCAGSFKETNLGLILVSRQVHAETAYLPYELSTFDCIVYSSNRIQWKPRVRKFLAKRSEEQIKAMSCLTLRRYAYEEQAFAIGTGLYWVKRLKIKKYRSIVRHARRSR